MISVSVHWRGTSPLPWHTKATARDSWLRGLSPGKGCTVRAVSRFAVGNKHFASSRRLDPGTPTFQFLWAQGLWIGGVDFLEPAAPGGRPCSICLCFGCPENQCSTNAT